MSARCNLVVVYVTPCSQIGRVCYILESMKYFLIGLMYHYPEEYKLWKSGHIEVYEASTGIYISAFNATEAIKWGRIIAKEFKFQ